MRVRIVTGSLLVVLLVGLTFVLGPGSPVDAKLQDAASPAASVATPEATAAPTDAAKAEVVTLVAWYSQDPSGDQLNVGPLRTNNSLVASQETGNDKALSGHVD